MDVLEKYKNTWQNQPKDIKELSQIDIYKMTYKKSSSIVKWIFIIGILEFILIATINFSFRLKPEEYDKIPNFKTLIILSEILSYLIMIYFLVRFYKNYKNISISDDTKTLMNKIIKTRKTVKLYVIINLGFITLFATGLSAYAILSGNIEDLNSKPGIVIFTGMIVVIAIVLALYWLFYQVIYGILLRKLNRNYTELAKLDELK